jgi:P27 family predicted phage terminase small subunit
VLRQTDRGILAAYCQAWSRWVGAERELKKSTPVLAGEKGLYQNPWVHVANKAIEQMSALGAQLGLSPSSRARVSGALPVETAAKHGPRAIADPVLDG